VETIIVEHQFEDRPFDIDRYNDAQRGNAWCLETHGVRHVVSYVTPDARRMICVFEAPDAEAVRRTARELGYKYDRLWPATIVR
jgi:Protein of unknown function (DUF4242)